VKPNTALVKYWRDVALQALGNSGAQLVGLLGIPILARVYSPEAFAMQNIFLQAVMFLAGIMTWRYEYFFQMLGVDAHVKYLFNWIVKIGLISCLILTALIYLGGVYIERALGVENLSFYLLFAPVSACFVSFALALQHCTQRDGDFKKSAMSEVTGKALYVGSGIVFSSFGTLGLILTSLSSAVGKIFALKAYLIKLLSLKAALISKEDSPRIRFAKSANSMVVSHLFLTVSGSLPILFISYQYGVEKLGQFTMVMATIFLPSGLIGVAIGQVFYQRAAQFYQASRDIRPLWRDTIIRLIVCGAPIYIFVAFSSKYIYPFVLGRQWVEAGQYAEILSAAAFFSFISSPLDRLSLVLRVNSYLPTLHFCRVVATLVAIAASYFFELSFVNYLIFLSLQMAALYVIDICFGRWFLSSRGGYYAS